MIGLLAVSSLACGSTANDSSSGDGDGDDGTGGSPETGDGDGDGDGDNGTGGSAGSSACTGTFGQATLFFEDTRTTSPALTGDELELSYVDGPSGNQIFKRAIRATVGEPFGPGEPVPELNTVCSATQDRFIDISEDGLRAYFGCYLPDDIASPSHSVYVAERPSREALWSGRDRRLLRHELRSFS